MFLWEEYLLFFPFLFLMENIMRKYLTEKEREKFRLIIINAKKQHLEKFEIEDYCKDNDIDYNIIASEVDSIRYSVKIENLVDTSPP